MFEKEKQGPPSAESSGSQVLSSDTSILAEASKLSCLDAALRYARNGWRVLPLHTPRGTNIIAEWWSKWPDANIGLVLDRALALDVDPKNGGYESLALLEKEYGPLKKRARQRSGSGGWHYLFADGRGVKIARGFRPGLDLLTGAGCYICVEPSLHISGNRYEWTEAPHPLCQHLSDHLKTGHS